MYLEIYCLCKCTCMHTHIHTHTHTYTHTHAHTHMHAQSHTHTHTRAHTRMHAHTHTLYFARLHYSVLMALVISCYTFWPHIHSCGFAYKLQKCVCVHNIICMFSTCIDWVVVALHQWLEKTFNCRLVHTRKTVYKMTFTPQTYFYGTVTIATTTLLTCMYCRWD